MKLLFVILALVYVLSPYDIFPDFFVGWGWLDDIILLFLLWNSFFSKTKRSVNAFNAYQRYRQFFNRGDSDQFSKNQRHNDFVSGKGGASKDPYTILGIEKNASPEEIKHAYKQLAGKYHPDKVVHLGDEFAELAESRFKEIQEAYQTLTAQK